MINTKINNNHTNVIKILEDNDKKFNSQKEKIDYMDITLKEIA